MAAQELTEHQSASGEQVHCASLVLYIPILLLLLSLLLFSSFLSFSTAFISTHKFYFFLILSPIPLGGGEVSERLVMLRCWLGLNHNSAIFEESELQEIKIASK